MFRRLSIYLPAQKRSRRTKDSFWRIPGVCIPAFADSLPRSFMRVVCTRARDSNGRASKGTPGLVRLGCGLFRFEHEGNQNAAPEEVERIAGIVDTLIQPGVNWIDDKGQSGRCGLNDILIVAPYNAQVSDLAARLPGARIGTVDKFQGQQAPVVIYSLTTSSPEDAPRGMEFLYSLNRLNVATSRAQAMVIVVGSPRLLEPECRQPRQMQLANALCRYVELAQTADSLVQTIGGN